MLIPLRSVRLSTIVAAVVVVALLLAASAHSASAQSVSNKTVQGQPGAIGVGKTGSYTNVGWNILDGFSIDPYTTNIKNAHLPANVTALDSVNVKIGGYMLPFEFGGTGVTEFAL